MSKEITSGANPTHVGSPERFEVERLELEPSIKGYVGDCSRSGEEVVKNGQRNEKGVRLRENSKVNRKMPENAFRSAMLRNAPADKRMYTFTRQSKNVEDSRLRNNCTLSQT